ncbi:ABC transporter ATP-binding protein [Pseudonocardia oroxyli]|uniref:NitT/TauT family transport system ATP-binding protein n=1 Tax=Pseudonocardia oroxyli TaxID=366584 RepID=A0A1G7SS11_PSEOR|nr:ABC transporter ATP-binding protein [Pseudonocardia oroxyli]SDG25070.1 NitT/TauT family transport system ATP-binding protein [Pseudonocardia oroxyli]
MSASQTVPSPNGVAEPTAEPRAFVSCRRTGLVYQGADGGEVIALTDLDLDIAEGEFVSLVGPSGCGKTTLLKIMGDLLAPTAGSVEIDGFSPRQLRERQRIGQVFQSAELLPWKSIADNLVLLAKLSGKTVPREQTEAMAETLGLQDFLHRYPHELSGGMQQRAAIGRALLLDPALLLMDEPFGALDEITREKLNMELQRIWSEHRKTVVFVTHSLSEAAFLSDRVVVLSGRPGRLVADVRIDAPRLRTTEYRFSSEMAEVVARLHGALTGEGEAS